MALDCETITAENIEPEHELDTLGQTEVIGTAPAELPTEEKTMPRRPSSLAAPLIAGLGALGLTVAGCLIKVLLTRRRSKRGHVDTAGVSTAMTAAPASDTEASLPMAEAYAFEATLPPGEAGASQPAATAVDLSPFGSPVGSTPVRIPFAKSQVDKLRTAPRATSGTCSDADDQSDNASVRDQRQSLIDAAQLQKTLKQMQEMAEENRKLSAFLAEYKADAEKLSKLEDENRALRDVTRQLELELQDLKNNTLPRTGAELEMFKNAVRVPAVARSVCSNDETILGVSTASVDGVIPDGRVRRNNLFQQLMATLQGTASRGTSQPTTPRGGASAARASGDSATGSARRRRQPGPEEAAVIGQAVYQLLDQFGGRMI